MSDLTTVHRPLTADELDRWIAELESGNHKQAMGQLRRGTDYDDGARYGYCCLGLKCQIAGFDLDATFDTYEDYNGNEIHEPFYTHPGTTVGKGGTPEPLHSLSYKTRSALASANDTGYTFADIAGVLRRFRDDLLAGRSLQYGGPVGGEWEVVA